MQQNRALLTNLLQAAGPCKFGSDAKPFSTCGENPLNLSQEISKEKECDEEKKKNDRKWDLKRRERKKN